MNVLLGRRVISLNDQTNVPSVVVFTGVFVCFTSTRRLLMVGLAEASAEKTMVRSHTGIRGAFVMETVSEGESGLAVQREGSCFETVWQLKEGGPNGMLEVNKVMYCTVLYCTVLYCTVVDVCAIVYKCF